MKPMFAMKPLLPMLAAAHLLTLTGCAPKTLRVLPAQPLPAPKVAVPKVLVDPVQRPTWLQ